MPLYELFCLARPALNKAQQAQLLRSAAQTVLQRGGVLTDLKSFGDRPLAYTVRRPGTKFDEAFMWQLSFAVRPEALSDLEHSLKVEEQVLRYILLKKRVFQPVPNTHTVSRMAQRAVGSPKK